MDIEKLAQLIQLPETHARVLGAYKGAYSLGIGEADATTHKPVLALQVEESSVQFPRNVKLGGETIPLVVRTGFKAPQALAAATR